MPAKSDPRDVAVDNYSYRRSLSARELLPAIGVGLAAGALAFYVARIMLERAPVTVEGLSRSARTKLPRVLPGPRGS
jgi:hypothetical protein